MSKLPFGFDAPTDSPGFLLWQTTTSWQRLIKKSLEEYSVSHSQFVIMALLLWLKANKNVATQIDLVLMSKLDKMTVSKSLKKLVDMNLVLRAESKEDSRAKSVSLTKSGIDLVKKLVPIVESVDTQFFSSLRKSQENSLISILQSLNL